MIRRWFGTRSMKVLFCGHNFSGGYLYSKEAIERRLQERGLNHDEISVIECAREDVHKELPTAAVAVPWMSKFTSKLMADAPHLRLVMQFGVGLEGVDIPAATRQGVYVARINSINTPGNAQSCAEHCIYLATASLRNVNELARSIRQGKLGWPVGRTIYGARTMVIGYGGIGRELLPRLLAMGAAHVTVVCRNIPTEAHNSDRVTFATFSDLFGVSAGMDRHHTDALFLCCTVNAENMKMVNKTFLDRFHPGLHIINVSRGHLMNFDDVLEAMNRPDNLVAGVGTDVFHTEPFPTPIETDPFLSHPKVVCTPHVAGVTEISYRNMAEVLADNVMRVYDGRTPDGVVNTELLAR